MTNILNIRPLRAQITLDEPAFNSMHPFVQFKLNGNKQKTNTHQNGNRNPFWSDEITYTGVPHNAELIVQVFDQNTYESGEAVAFAEINLDQHLKLGQITQIDVPLQNMGDPSGQITLLMKLAPPPTKGTIHIRPIRAQITLDEPAFNAMHPFVQIKHNGNKKKTNSHINGNRNPFWNEEICFEVGLQDELIIQIFDQNTYESGEAVAFAETTVGQIAKFGQKLGTDIEVQNMGDPSGHIHLQTELIPEGGDLASYLAKQNAGFGSFGAGFGDNQGGFSQGGFQPQGGFAPQGGFQPQGGFAPQGGFQSGGFAPQGGFQSGGFQSGGFQ